MEIGVTGEHPHQHSGNVARQFPKDDSALQQYQRVVSMDADNPDFSRVRSCQEVYDMSNYFKLIGSLNSYGFRMAQSLVILEVDH